MKTYELNRATESAYRCLCRDRGFEYLPARVDVRQLHELRKELLQYLEAWPSRPEESDANLTFAEIYSKINAEYQDLSLIHI